VRRRALAALAACSSVPDQPLKVKIPEGYAVYGLFPEQYELAARSWLASHPAARRCAVVGIRSIGTSLSAVVAATLKAAGKEVVRMTVRPTGHPFNRNAELPRDRLGNFDEAIIVDEGPGLSGSSMAAVAEALAAAGIAPERITFFPGHSNEPGAAASDSVRDWWRCTPRITAEFLPLILRFNCQDLSGGAWRSVAYQDPSDWPAACAAFERRKFLHAPIGGYRLFSKFTGFAATDTQDCSTYSITERWALLAYRGWTPLLASAEDGFITRNWIDGRPLRPDDAPLLPPHRLGQYISEAAGPPLDVCTQTAAIERLSSMLQHNIVEAFGVQIELPRPALDVSLPTAGDGRLGPRDWILTPAGKVLKADCGGHDLDHTMVGCQPLPWDIAGAIIEWNMPPAAINQLIAACPPIPREVLRFYRLAYAAFRMGQCALCASMAGDEAERLRLERARDFYGNSIRPMLFTHSTQGP
jgi:hypothetical protein